MSLAGPAEGGAAPEPPFDAFARIDQPVAYWAERAPSAPAVRAGGRALSYGEFDAAIARAAGFLAGQGVGAGDRVLILLENGLAAATLLFAAVKLGAWVVPVNARLTGPEVAAIRNHARPRLSFYTTGVSPEAAAHARADGARSAPALDAAYRVEPGDPEPEPADRDDPIAALLYTSGTTGAPKGVMLSHGNLLFVSGRTTWTRDLGLIDRVYGVLPISHVYGLSAVLIRTLYRGACLDLVPRFDAQAAARALAEDGITVFQGVPAIYAHLMALAQARGAALAAPRLRYASVGGAPLDPALKAEVEAMFGIPLQNGYGLTETSPTVSVTRHETPCADDSTGQPLPGVELRIVDADGRALPANEVGELRVRGGLVMQGYYRDPERTAEALTPEGWLRTGDLARLSEAGDLTIVGRLKELIIRSGFNVYPAEVEAAITGHPGVALAAVVGRRSRGNEEPVAFVQPRPGAALAVADLAAYVAERLAPYKRPAEYILRAALPVTPAGKILKHQLETELEGGTAT
ncbi:MAG: AMP-binding protein [Proteobacteria bacterium]|nr:AMP-binding protein [Pseudomonadota bacterium]